MLTAGSYHSVDDVSASRIDLTGTIAHKLADCPVDFRLLVVGLLLNASVPLFFSLLWGLVRSLAVGQNLTSLLDISIVAMIAVLSFGLFLVGYGLVRGGVVKDWQAGILFLGSLALGVLTFTFYVSMGIAYGDDLAACGGIPPGTIWNPQDVILTRCDIFYRVQWYPTLQWVWTMPLAATGLAFLGSFIAARRLSLAQ